MESNRVLIAALLFIIAVIVINYSLFIIVRAWAKGSDSGWMSALRNSLRKPLESSSSKSMDELRKKMDELRGNDKENM